MASTISNLQLLRRTTAIFGLLLSFCLSSAQADLDSYTTPKLKKKTDDVAAVSLTATAAVANGEVNRGGETLLILRGIARSGGQIEFRLVQKPLHGRILSSKPIGLDQLQVRYRHSGEAIATDDSFIFAVRAQGSGPFSPGEAKIHIVDTPGRLMAPDNLEFPRTLVGKTAADSFVLMNDGGAPISGTIDVSPPWTISGPLTYRLNPRESRKIDVSFAPDRGGPFEGRILFSGSDRSTIELSGQGAAPFTASPQKLLLVPDLSDKRVGSVTLQNASDGPLTITITSEFDLPKSIVLQFAETREIPIADSGIGPLNSVTSFTSGKFSARVAISASERIRNTVPVLNPSIRPTETAPPQATPSSTFVSQPVSTPSASPPIFMPIRTPEEAPGEDVTGPQSEDHEAVEASIQLESTDSARLEWRYPKERPSAEYRIEQRYLLLDAAHDLQIKWVPVPSAKIALTADRGMARIGDLDSDTPFTFRVLQASGDESTRLSSRPLSIRTPPGFLHRLGWHWLLYLGGGVLLALVLWNRWRAHSEKW